MTRSAVAVAALEQLDILPRLKAKNSNPFLRCWKEYRLRFAVQRPGQIPASPRSHRMPCGDVDGRIHVSVSGETADRATEVGLALARLTVHMPARRAPLARVRSFDLLDPTGGLLLQAAHQQAPAGRGDLPVQPGLLADVPAWVLDRPLGRASHAFDLQFFNSDH